MKRTDDPDGPQKKRERNILYEENSCSPFLGAREKSKLLELEKRCEVGMCVIVVGGVLYVPRGRFSAVCL